jgi:hypothetical protein
MLPRLEFAAVLNNWEGKLGAQRLDAGPSADYNMAGYNVDRSVAVHWQAVTERGYQPAIAIGTRDLFGTQQLQRSHYAVASWKVTPFGERQPLDLSVGYGTRHLGGAFAGIEYSPHPRATLVLERLRGQVHGGLRVEPIRNFQLDAGLMGFRSLGGGLSYRRRF